MEVSTLSSISIPADPEKHSAAKTVHITVTSTVLQDPAAVTSVFSLIHQTKPLDFIALVRPTRIAKSAPEMTVQAFEFYTPSADTSISVLAEVTPTKSNSGPTPDVPSTDASTASDSHNAGAKIAGIIIGIVFILLIIPLMFEYWRARRRGKAYESAPVDMEAVLKQKRERAKYLAKQRWSRQHIRQSLKRYQAVQAKLVADVVKDKDPVVEAESTTSEIQNPQVRHDRARRPSGLAMHPPTPVVSEHNLWCNEQDGEDVGRAR